MPGIAIGAEYASNLTGWSTAAHGFSGVTITETNDGLGVGVDKVDVSIPKSRAVGSKLFVRFMVKLS